MSALKQQVIDFIRTLPDDCTLEDILYHLYVREKVERGIRAVEEGRTIPQEKVERESREWLKSSGRSQA